MKKYIFLDIDGVISTQRCRYKLDPEKQLLLGKILTVTKAKIVLSSSWRKHTLEETKEYMNEEGFLFTDKIIGQTIRTYHYLDKTKKIHLSIPRGVEIKQWVDTNILSDNGINWGGDKLKFGKDFSYVILDDDKDMLLEHKDCFINTDPYLGLSEEDTEKAIKILNC